MALVLGYPPTPAQIINSRHQRDNNNIRSNGVSTYMHRRSTGFWSSQYRTHLTDAVDPSDHGVAQLKSQYTRDQAGTCHQYIFDHTSSGPMPVLAKRYPNSVNDTRMDLGGSEVDAAVSAEQASLNCLHRATHRLQSSNNMSR